MWYKHKAMKTILLTALALTITLSLHPQVSVSWDSLYTGQYEGTGSSKVLTDAQGNVFVMGGGTYQGGYNEILLIKYDKAGVQQWVQRYMASNVGAHDMEMDAAGNIYICGINEVGLNDGNFLTIKFDNNGNLLWGVQYDSGMNDDAAYDIELDAAGNAYVSGYSQIGNVMWGVLIKYDPSGQQKWIRKKAWEAAYCMEGDAAGNMVIGTGDEVYKYDANGTLLWTLNTLGANALELDGNGNIYLAGNTSSYDYIVSKLSPSGSIAWSTTTNGSTNDIDQSRCIALDNQGNVFVSGTMRNSWNEDIMTVKYDNNGNELWKKVYNGAAGSQDDVPNDIVADGKGDVYLTGKSYNVNQFPDFITMKYDKNGNKVWEIGYDSNGSNMANEAFSIALDYSSGQIDVVVTGGRSWIASWMIHRSYTVKYTQSPTGLSSADEVGAATVYPNPFSGSAILRADGFNKTGRVLVTDASGRLVKEMTWDPSTAEMVLEGFASGLYLYTLESEEKRQNGKFIVQ